MFMVIVLLDPKGLQGPLDPLGCREFKADQDHVGSLDPKDPVDPLDPLEVSVYVPHIKTLLCFWNLLQDLVFPSHVGGRQRVLGLQVHSCCTLESQWALHGIEREVQSTSVFTRNLSFFVLHQDYKKLTVPSSMELNMKHAAIHLPSLQCMLTMLPAPSAMSPPEPPRLSYQQGLPALHRGLGSITAITCLMLITTSGVQLQFVWT